MRNSCPGSTCSTIRTRSSASRSPVRLYDTIDRAPDMTEIAKNGLGVNSLVQLYNVAWQTFREASPCDIIFGTLVMHFPTAMCRGDVADRLPGPPPLSVSWSAGSSERKFSASHQLPVGIVEDGKSSGTSLGRISDRGGGWTGGWS